MPSPKTTFNADLVDDFARRKGVLFLGAGVSASSNPRDGGTAIPTWSAFLASATQQLKSSQLKRTVTGFIQAKDFLFAAEILKEEMGKSWDALLTREFGRAADASSLHSALLDLNQRIIITTNFDKILDAALMNRGAVVNYPIAVSKIDASVFRILRDDRDYIIKVHGTIDDIATLIFTKSEYIERAYGNWAYSEFLTALLLTHTFLFVGFSMSDPAVSLAVELYAHRYRDGRPHYIVLPEPVPESVKNISKKVRKLYAITYDPKNKHKALPRLIEKLCEEVQFRTKELASAAVSGSGTPPSTPTKRRRRAVAAGGAGRR